MARNLYGCTSADFTLTESGRVVAGATATVWTARTGGTQITDLTDLDGDPITLVTSDADGGIRFYGVDGDKDTYWLDTGTGARIAVRPVDLTGEIGPTPDLTIGTVTTGTAAATITGTDAAPVLNLTLPTAGANGVDTAAIQDGAVTAAKIANDTITATQVAANAIGSSELADNAVDTAAIADGAVTPAKMATTGRFTFPTGAANGYGFTSGASHLSGTGTPEGVVTAAPGSTWLQTDSTTDVKGWIRWIKASGTGNTGWVAGPEADTGWRDIAGDITWPSASGDVLGVAKVRRTGDGTCSLYVRGAIGSTTADTIAAVGALPAGFRPTIDSQGGFLFYTAMGDTSLAPMIAVHASNYSPWTISIQRVGGASAANWSGGLGRLVTADAWPTSLPGVAV